MDPLPTTPTELLADGLPSKDQRRRRITNAGVAILEDFLHNVSNNPNKIQTESLLAQIRGIAGCEEYQEKTLKTWFQTRRKKRYLHSAGSSHAGPSVAGSVEHASFLYPSLTEQSIKHLKIMFQPQQDPSPDIIKTWALLLGATERDIWAWINANRAQDSSAEQPFHAFHMPTPAESSSPESSKLSSPSIQPPSIFKSEASQSPIISSFPVPPTTGPSAMPSSLPQSVYCAPKPPSTELIVRTLTAAISDTLNPATLAQPRTAAEFNALFAPYQAKMESFLQKVEDGSLREWGWDPSAHAV